MKRALLSFAVFFIIGVTLPLAFASDLAKEKRWAEQIVEALFDGEAVWLKAGDHDFLGIYTEPTGEKSKGGVIVLHGIGVHPDWPQVVYPLRTGLAERGWHTLSLQMPVLPNEADITEYGPLYAEVPARMKAGIEYLRNRGVQEVALVGHSLGAQMAVYHAARSADGIGALVGVALSARSYENYFDVAESMAKIRVPILDLFGDQDFPIVMEGAGKRQGAAKKAGNTRYKQVQVAGADHFFTDKDTELVEIVESWLSENMPAR